jgi:N-acetylglutamate synthase-like GNAT family acetyltransferase
MLKSDKNYQLFICLKDNSVVGMSLMYIFRSLGIGLLDYMAVKPNYQRQGLGREISLKALLGNLHLIYTMDGTSNGNSKRRCS